MKILPELKLTEDQVKDTYTLTIKGESVVVPGVQLRQCWADLRIISFDDFHRRFAKVCDWFIAQDQYVQFKEVKKKK